MNMASENIFRDGEGREINYLRLSVAGECNLRCAYCIPRNGRSCAGSRTSMLDFEDITRIVLVLAGMGITKVRLTGGEPLARKNISSLVGMLSSIKAPLKIAMTTNGIEMAEHADKLKAAGLAGVNIHLDSLNESTYRLITGSSALNEAIGGIGAAINAGFEVKLNTVLMRGINDAEAEELIGFASGMGVPIRFIEMMPMGAAVDFCKKHFISTHEMKERLRERYALSPVQTEPVHGPAEYYSVADLNAVVGFIGHSSNVFCASCNRLRLLPDGTLINCIATSRGLALANFLSRMDDVELKDLIREYVMAKPRDHGGFTHAGSGSHFNMHAIGG